MAGNFRMKRLSILAALFIGATAFAQSYPGTNNSAPQGAEGPVNDPPVWNNTPAPTAVSGIVSSYELSSDVSDPESDTLTITNETGCTLPTGVTIDDANDQIDFAATTVAGTTTNCVFGADDGTNARVDSLAFPIEISSAAAGLGYPRIAARVIAGWFTDDFGATEIDAFGVLDFIILGLGTSRDVTPTHNGLTYQQILDRLRAVSPNIVACQYVLAHSYFDPAGSYGSYPTTVIGELESRTGPDGLVCLRDRRHNALW